MLLRRVDGASAPEYVMLVALVGMVAVLAFAQFGFNEAEQVDCLAGAIGGGVSGPCHPNDPNAPTRSSLGVPWLGPPGDSSGDVEGEPSLRGVPAGSGAEYEPIRAPLFVVGEGDRGDIDANDVRQGHLGDCAFMAALASLADRDPEVIRRMIRDNGDGTYTVTFRQPPGWFSSEWGTVSITVTNQFPMGSGSGMMKVGRSLRSGAAPTSSPEPTSPEPVAKTPVFAGLGDGELWVMVMEKAYAQWKGGFGALQSGTGVEEMQALSGAPSRIVGDTAWEQWFGWNPSLEDMAAALERGATMMATTTGGNKNHGLLRDSVLLEDHFYFITGFDVVAQKVTVNNGWGWARDAAAVQTIDWADFKEAFRGIVYNER